MSKKIIGVLTVPLSPGRKYYKVCGDGYIATAHAEWLERAGLTILAIPFDTKDHKYYFKRINGLYLPSGGAFASTQPEYYKSSKQFIILAMEANNNGNYFPIWGGCMGMQQMMIMGDGRDDLGFLEKFDSFNNLMLPLLFTEEGISGKMCSHILKNNPKNLKYMMESNCTLNNHMLGVSPEKFKNSKHLSALYNIVSWNYDRQGKKFVSTIEGKHYPFYGVQWHPERAKDMDFLAKFLASEVSKNKHKKRVPDSKTLQYKRVDCMRYSNDLYNNCNFYWHKTTSEHNKNLCNVLNLGKPTSNAI